MSPPSVLVVEENEAHADVLRENLADAGYSFSLAVNGPAGVAMAVELLPDIVLMGTSLPLIDGLEATRLLRKHPDTQGILILCMTDRAMSTPRESCLAAGCDDTVVRPVDIEQLLPLLQQHLDRRPQPLVESLQRQRARKRPPRIRRAIDDLDPQIVALSEMIDGIEAELKAATHGRDRLEALLGERDARLAEATREKAEALGEIGRLSALLAAANAERDRSAAALDQASSERDGLIRERDALRTVRDGLLAERSEARDALQAERDGVSSERERLRVEREERQRERLGLEEQRSALQREKEEIETERHTLRQELERLRVEHGRLRQEFEALASRPPPPAADPLLDERHLEVVERLALAEEEIRALHLRLASSPEELEALQARYEVLRNAFTQFRRSVTRAAEDALRQVALGEL